jgi:hypothetical protein
MIISHKHKFIFLKTKKTAGTSIEISLSRYCGNKDIITPISPADEKIRSKLGKSPQNYQLNQQGLYNHISAKELKSVIGEEVWNTYYKFSFDRNPWDKVISFYYYSVGDTNKEPFSEFLDLKKYKETYNFPIYTINNHLAVDYIGKYESLENDLNVICKKIGLPFDDWLPNAKGSFRKNRQPYQTQYNQQQKEMVQNYFKAEIDLLDYKF